jgi:hypothetical protein
MVAHGDEEIEEELPTLLHLDLHGAAALECVPAADDEGEVVGAKLRVAVRGVGICEASRGEDSADLNTSLKALLAKGKAFELVEAVAVGCTAG